MLLRGYLLLTNQIGAEMVEAVGIDGLGERRMLAEMKNRLRKLKEERYQWMLKKQERLVRKKELEECMQRETQHQAQDVTVVNDENLDQVMIDANQDNMLQKRLEGVSLLSVASGNPLVSLSSPGTATAVSVAAPFSKTKRKRESNPDIKQKPTVVIVNTARHQHEAPILSVLEPELLIHDMREKADGQTSIPKLSASILFRLATRHFIQFGQKISISSLMEGFRRYTRIHIDAAAFERVRRSFSVLNDLISDASMSNCIEITPNSHLPRWIPGHQFLDFLTFCSDSSERLQAYIDLEKQVLDEICDSALAMTDACGYDQQLLQSYYRVVFLSSVMGDTGSMLPSDIWTTFCACTRGNNSSSEVPISRRIPFRSFRQLSELFMKMETVLPYCAEEENGSSRIDGDTSWSGKLGSASASTTRPFSLEEDSVMKQLTSVPPDTVTGFVRRKRGRIDPMKTLCMYELNGVCSDENCSYLHQRDFEPPESGDEDDDKAMTKRKNEEAEKDQRQFVYDFALVRSNQLNTWPLITTKSVIPKPVERANVYEENKPVVESSGLECNGGEGFDGIDFIRLDDIDSNENARSETDENEEDIRYYHQDETTELSREALQKKIASSNDDTDSWLLLAISELELHVPLSDDAVAFSDSAKLQEQLIALHQLLYNMAMANATNSLGIGEDKLKRSLHTLSRALEVEANAYCEALWLMYLQLANLLPVQNKDLELEMAEQAVQFLPKSRRLWLYYLSTCRFESLDVAEGMHYRILQHLSGKEWRENAELDKHEGREFSVLLTAVVVHLSIILCRAEATVNVLLLLEALLQLDSANPDFEWCDQVRSRLCIEEHIALALIYAHVTLFAEVPKHVYKWVKFSYNEPLRMESFAYTLESFQARRFDGRNIQQDYARAIKAYDIALRESEKCNHVNAHDVILSNRVIILAQASIHQKNHGIVREFLEEKLPLLLQYPGASYTTSQVYRHVLQEPSKAHAVMQRMVADRTQRDFPRALHFYLCEYQTRSSDDTHASTSLLLDMLISMAITIDVTIQHLQVSLLRLDQETNPVARSKELKKLLYALVSTWMDRLSACNRSLSTRDSPDIYFVITVCQVMSVLIGPSDAIEGLELLLGSSMFCRLPMEARQLVWAMRFIFQFDHLESDNYCRGTFTQLLRRYLSEMTSVTTKQVSERFSKVVQHQGIQAAIIECLCPGQMYMESSSDLGLELFRLCLATLPASQKSGYFSSFLYSFSSTPEFALAFYDIAVHDWELRKVRVSLRRSIASGNTSVLHAEALRALVSLELRQQNTRAVALLLERCVQSDPLCLEGWRLVTAMEILFGERSSSRSKELANDFQSFRLRFTSNTYGDSQLANWEDSNGHVQHEENVSLCSLWKDERANLNLQRLALYRVPNFVLLNVNLISLNLSGNFLVELPDAIGHLTKLQTLDVSNNSLFIFPSCVGTLMELKNLDLSHNNLSTVPMSIWKIPSKLCQLDLRANIIKEFPIEVLDHLSELQSLHIMDNQLSTADEQNLMGRVMRNQTAACRDTSDPINSVTNTHDESMVDVSTQSKQMDTQNHQSAIRSSNDENTINGGTIGTDEIEMVAHEDAITVEDGEVQRVSADEVLEHPGSNLFDHDQVSASQDSLREQNSVNENRSAVPAAHQEEDVDSDGVEFIGFSRAEAPTQAHDSTAVVVSPTFIQTHQSSPQSGRTTMIFSEAGEFERIMQSTGTSRADMRHKYPHLWRQHIRTRLTLEMKRINCVLCSTPNNGNHQRLNTMVLCPLCLRDAVDIVLEQHQTQESLDIEESKGNHEIDHK